MRRIVMMLVSSVLCSGCVDDELAEWRGDEIDVEALEDDETLGDDVLQEDEHAWMRSESIHAHQAVDEESWPEADQPAPDDEPPSDDEPDAPDGPDGPKQVTSFSWSSGQSITPTGTVPPGGNSHQSCQGSPSCMRTPQ
ncbi:hypothetical protein [Paraliomyxa miuraensis]|uniref:hypothetical protein n=1 Tax=Paraliomyxa miuraensis TaxID=376150 RepID=UPI0022506925|nr:hypothetical protein [Paraliomyxa miuraensis]MCX4242453.1 hypothetical protein [Paraliomyxa miuraensis]